MKNQNLIPGQTYSSMNEVAKIAKKIGLEETSEDALFSVNSISAGAVIEFNGKLYWSNLADQKQLLHIKNNKRNIVLMYVLKVPTQYNSLEELTAIMKKNLKKSIALFEAKLAINSGKKIIAINKESEIYRLQVIEELPERNNYHSFWI